jgi:hypothetical protein
MEIIQVDLVAAAVAVVMGPQQVQLEQVAADTQAAEMDQTTVV